MDLKKYLWMNEIVLLWNSSLKERLHSNWFQWIFPAGVNTSTSNATVISFASWLHLSIIEIPVEFSKVDWNLSEFFFSSFEFHIVFRFRHSFHYPLLFSSFSLFSSLSMHFFSFLFFLFTWGCWKRLRHNAFLKSLENDQTPFSFLILNWVRKFQLTRVRIFSSSLVCFSSVFL